MLKISVNELSGAALDYAVALAEGYTLQQPKNGRPFLASPRHREGDEPPVDLASAERVNFYVNGYSTGPDGDEIIDREGISVIRCDDNYGKDARGFTTNERIPVWAATVGQHSADETYGSQGDRWGRAYALDVVDVVYGATRREAALRAYVWYKLGRKVKTVEIPKELA